MTRVYLVPGFFGFTELGTLNYFHRVSEVLGEALAERTVDAEIIEVETLPTASIRRRASKLLDTVMQRGEIEQDALHFVGHSTGGLDIRLLLTPGVRLRETEEETVIARHTRTAIMLSTPHYGTPLANFFATLQGQHLLYLLTLLVVSTPGRLGAYMLARTFATFAHLDRIIGQRSNVFDLFAENLLGKITPKRGDAIWDFVREVSKDQGSILQLTPESMDIFNAAVLNQQGIEYVCFVNASPKPGVSALPVNPRDLYQSVTFLVYFLSYVIASREHKNYPYPVPVDSLMEELRGELKFPIDSRTNDGIVPLLSQIWGRLGGVLLGDHLDVVGHFSQGTDGKEYSAWLHSGSGFDESRFVRLWSDIAATIAGAEK